MASSKQANKLSERSSKEWLKVKSALVRQYSWLNSYRDITTPLDRTIFEAVKGINVRSPFPHEVLLVEPLLADIAALLERGAAYRRELYSLEVNAITSALSFNLGSVTGNIDGQLSKVRNRKEEADILRRAQAKAASAFGDSPALNKAFRAEAQGQAGAFDVISAREAAAKVLEKERFSNIVSFNDTLLKAIAAPGSGFNFAERYNQIKVLLIEDVQEAYRKALCAEVGLNKIFPADSRFRTFRDHPVPKPRPTGFFDELISWTREAMRRIERISEFETEYDLMVPLTRALINDGEPLVSRQEFNDSIMNTPLGDGRINFDLKNVFPSQTAVRLRGVGLGYVRNSEDDQFIRGNRRLRCVLFTPEQRPGTGEPYRRPPVILNNVGELIVEHSGATIEAGQNIYNVDPRGVWTLLIFSRAYSSAGFTTTMLEERDDLLLNGDIVLHLRVRALAEVNPGDWEVV
jgi:hypothetical protein